MGEITLLSSPRRQWLGLAMVFGLALLLRYPIARIPLERDEGEYAYIAQRWVKGEIPYKDSFDQKPPLAFVAYVVFNWVGTGPAAIHWGAQVYTLGTLLLIFLLGRRLFSADVGLLAAAAAAFLTSDFSVLGNAANTETFMILPMTGALLASLRAVELSSWRWSFLAGALSALAMLGRQTALFNLLFCSAFVSWPLARGWLRGVSLLIGAVTVLSAVAGYFILVDAGGPFYECVVGYNLAYADRTPLAYYPVHCWYTFRTILLHAGPIYVAALAGLGIGIVHGDALGQPWSRRSTWILAGWLLASFLGVSSGGLYRNHYFIQAIPAIALLAGVGFQALFLLPVSPNARRALPTLACAGAILYGVLSTPWYYLYGTPEEKSRAIYGPNPFVESAAVARLIARYSRPNDTVFIMGSEPQILYYAERKSASRFIFVYPLMIPTAAAREFQQSVIEELRQNKPEIVVTVFVPSSHLLHEDTPPELLDELQRMLDHSYQVVAALRMGDSPRMQLESGPIVEEMWAKAPMWYDSKYVWTWLVVWQKRYPPADGE